MFKSLFISVLLVFASNAFSSDQLYFQGNETKAEMLVTFSDDEMKQENIFETGNRVILTAKVENSAKGYRYLATSYTTSCYYIDTSMPGKNVFIQFLPDQETNTTTIILNDTQEGVLFERAGGVIPSQEVLDRFASAPERC